MVERFLFVVQSPIEDTPFPFARLASTRKYSLGKDVNVNSTPGGSSTNSLREDGRSVHIGTWLSGKSTAFLWKTISH